MKNRLNYATLFAALIVSSFSFGTGSTLATEVADRGDVRLHFAHTVYDTQLVAEPTAADHLLIHIEGTDMRNQLGLLQRPYFEINLSEREVRLGDLRALLPIAPQVLGLNLLETDLDNDAFPLIMQLTALTSLDVSDNRFDDEGVSFATLKDLRHLRIARSQITAKVLETLAQLKKLESIDVGCTRIGNAGIKAICQISSLKNVNVRCCGFDNTVLQLFLGLPLLETLNISDNSNLVKQDLGEFLRQAELRRIKVEV